MASQTSESIAFTEKVDMALDDIIKMSKDKPTKSKKQRVLNKSHKLFDGTQNKSLKVRQYMDSRSSIRQGALAQRRTNFLGNRFPVTSEAAKKAAVAPMRNRGFNRNGTANWNRQRSLYNLLCFDGKPEIPATSGLILQPESLFPKTWANATMNRQGNGPAKGFPMKPRFQQQQRQPQKQQQPRQQQQHQSLPQTMPKTLDSLFASMKEQRMQTFGLQGNGQTQQRGPIQQRQQQQGGRGQRFRY